MKYPLYPWQEKCLEKWCENQYHGIINVVTGSGKTFLALAAARLLMLHTGASHLRIRIVVPNASLLSQWTLAILDFFEGAVSRRDIGLYYSGFKNKPDCLFMIYVVNSARHAVARHIVNDINEGFTVFFIADECHRYTGNENQKIFDFLPFTTSSPGHYASLGLSATPGLERPENAAVLIPALGPEIFRYGFEEAEEAETLCPYVAFHIALSFTEEEQLAYEEISLRLLKIYKALISAFPSLRGMGKSGFFRTLFQLAGSSSRYAGQARLYLNFSYKRKNITSDAKARIACVLKLISLLDSSARIIVFGERIEQADLLYKKLEAHYPNQTARYHSGLSAQSRKLALERFHDGEVRILISCRSLDEGFDVPAANVGIVMSSASVNRQRIQRLGRILRRFEGKDISSLYYLYIAGSSEEQSYFPVEARTAAACDLSYSMETNEFSHPDYEDKVRSAMQAFRLKNPAPCLLSEAESCFRKGLIRPDWLFSEKYCSQKIDEARSTAERNYWICMKQLAKQT